MLPPRRNRVDPRANEHEAIRTLDKPEAHKRVSEEWFIPEYTAHCMSRQLLNDYMMGNIYRIPAAAMAHFWADLPPDAKAVTNFFSTEIAFLKIQRLLADEGLLPIGMTADDLPNRDFIIQVLRYLDRKNISFCFRSRVPNAPLLTGMEGTQAYRTAHAQSIVVDRVFFLNGVNLVTEHAYLGDRVQALWENKRKYLALDSKINRLQIHQPQLLDQRQQLLTTIQNLIREIGFALCTIREPHRFAQQDPSQTEQGRNRARQYRWA